jgi:hypothetical protein
MRHLALVSMLAAAAIVPASLASAAAGDGAKRVANGSAGIFTWAIWLEKPSKGRLCILQDWALPDSDEKPSAKDAADSANRNCVKRNSKGRYPHKLVVASVAGADLNDNPSEAGGYYGIVPAATKTVRVVSTKGKSTKVAHLRVYKAPKGFPSTVKVFAGIASPNVHRLDVTKVRIEARDRRGKVLISKRFVA